MATEPEYPAVSIEELPKAAEINPVLKRLLEEVRFEKATGVIHAYDRVHRRHNRS